jgi:glycosyltransferase involved in cell wall biosynthesis
VVADAPTLGLALIARDEEATLPHLLRSIEGAFDQVVLVDTGSEDSTAEVFEEWAERQDFPLDYKLDRFEWCDDFAAARNAADALLETDWLAYADCDDEMVGAERLRGLVYATPEDVTHALLSYAFAQPGQSLDFAEHYRLFRRGFGCWSGPVHEMKHLHVDDRRAARVDREVCYWKTRRHGWRQPSAERNRRIARQWVRREPNSARALFCAAREELLFCRGDEGFGPWLGEANLQLGMQHAHRFLRLVGKRGLLGPYGLGVAQRALSGVHRDNDPALNLYLFKIALQDPAEWPYEIRREICEAHCEALTP